LFREFSPTSHSRDELRFIQLSLAFEGYYQGLLDGAWGKLSNRALSKYTDENFESEPLNAHTAFLAITALERVNDEGWQYRYFDLFGFSFLVPGKTLLAGDESDSYVNFEHGNSSLKYSLTFDGPNRTQNIHDYAEQFHQRPGAPYTVRKPGFAVTSSQNARGERLYVRSRLWHGQWSTLLLSADQHDAGLLGAVSSSISNNSGIQLRIPEGGLLLSDAKETRAILAAETDQEKPSAPNGHTVSPQHGNDGARTGTGFWVSPDGHVLTNAHVVEGCTTIKVNGVLSTLVNSSENFDLALILTQPNEDVARFSTLPAKLNQDITVVGYPLSFILGGVNVTRGAISSMTGLAGDEMTMQISAPVQTGNSGGPVISSNGTVLGVVVSKLDAEAVQGAFGDTPQNINFAVRGEVAKLFLTLNGVEPRLETIPQNLTPIELAEQAIGFTAFIECN